MKVVSNVNHLAKGLIRVLHPDFFVSAGSQIQASNLVCVKSVNEVLNFVGLIDQSLKNKRLFSITYPLPAKFESDCFIRIEEEIRKSKFKLILPQLFTTRTDVGSSSELENSTKELFYNLMETYEHCKLVHPLITNDSIQEARVFRENQRPNISEEPHQPMRVNTMSAAVEKAFYNEAYGRWIKLELAEKQRRKVSQMFKQNLMSRREQKEEMSDEFLQNELIDYRKQAKGRKDKQKKPRKGTSMYDHAEFSGVAPHLEKIHDIMNTHVDLYVQSGNLLLGRGLSSGAGSTNFSDIYNKANKRESKRYDNPSSSTGYGNVTTEMSVIGAFRQFILENGSKIHFSIENYGNVIICIHDKERVEGYECNKHKDKYYILDIPYPFRSKELIRFIQDKVPVANILLQGYDTDILSMEDDFNDMMK